MLSSLALALAMAQVDEAAPVAECPNLTLSASPARVVTLAATDFTAWSGPVIVLSLASTAEEAQSFGTLSLIRLDGKPMVGGMMRRRVGSERNEDDGFSFELSFEPEQLAAVAAATGLELVASDGSVIAVPLTPANPAPLNACIAAHQAPGAPRGDPLTRRAFTFVLLEPNQPLRLRYRGDPAPMYPAAALSEAREGVSRVAVTIGVSGRITACTVIVSTGHADLDLASCRAARISAYLPETDARGEPVETKREQQLNWIMQK